MKKSLVAAVVAATTMMVASVGFASPLTDYSVGKTSVDVMFRNSDITGDFGGQSYKFSKKNNVDWGITTGLGKNFAFQFNMYNPKSKNTVFTVTSGSLQLKAQEFNVLYKMSGSDDANVSAFLGMVTTKGVLNNTVTEFTSDSKNKLQFGFVASMKLADKTSAYAGAGFANDYTSWKLGVSQEVAPNVELNLDYRNAKAKKLVFPGSNVDIEAKGLGFGLSYKF